MGLHEEFRSWIADGAPGMPARDTAVHAVGCEECRAQASALDALAGIDLDGAGTPTAGERIGGGLSMVNVAQLVSGIAAVVLLVAAMGMFVSSLLPNEAPGEVGQREGDPQQNEGVLGGQGGTRLLPGGDPEAPDPDASEADDSAEDAAGDLATDADSAANPPSDFGSTPLTGPVAVSSPAPPGAAPPDPTTPDPTTPEGPQPVAPTVPTEPSPTPPPATTAPTPTPLPTVAPTPRPTPIATPTPVPTPEPPAPDPTPTPTLEPTPTPTPILPIPIPPGSEEPG